MCSSDLSIAAVVSAIASNQPANVFSTIKQYQKLLVDQDYGRSSDAAVESLTGQYSEIIQFLYDSETFFNVLTSYYQTASGDSGVALASAVGPLGLEFRGDLDDKKTQEVMRKLAASWNESGKGVAQLLSVMASIQSPQDNK